MLFNGRFYFKAKSLIRGETRFFTAQSNRQRINIKLFDMHNVKSLHKAAGGALRSSRRCREGRTQNICGFYKILSFVF